MALLAITLFAIKVVLLHTDRFVESFSEPTVHRRLKMQIVTDIWFVKCTFDCIVNQSQDLDLDVEVTNVFAKLVFIFLIQLWKIDFLMEQIWKKNIRKASLR